MKGHLTDTELGQFVRGLLPADGLMAADDHLAACDACRTRAARIGDAGARLLELQRDVEGVREHLSDEQIQHYVRAELSAAERASVDRHLGDCQTCARDVRDLQAFASRPARMPRLWLAVAAAVLLLLTPLAIWRLSQDGEQRVDRVLSGIDLLSAEEQARVTAALQAGVVEVPESLAGLTGGSDVLMGTGTAVTFRVLAPIGTVTVSDRPEFRWEPLTGATAYAVAVLDQDSRQVAGAAGVMATTWMPPRSLARGQSYAWQVTARRGGESVIAPAPPAPVARFHVMDEQSAASIDRVSRAHPQSHVLLGILYTQAGARAEAEMHLRQVVAADAHLELARRSLERLQGDAPR